MERHSVRKVFDLTTAVATTPAIPFAGFAGGGIILPTTNTAVLLTFHTGDGVGSEPYEESPGTAAGLTPTFAPLKDKTNTAVTRTVTGGSAASSIPLPDECFGFRAIKIVADAAIAGVIITLKA